MEYYVRKAWRYGTQYHVTPLAPVHSPEHGITWPGVVGFTRRIGLKPLAPDSDPVEERYEDDSSVPTAVRPEPLWPLEHHVLHKEHSRKYRRTVYNFARWAEHRSAKRYAENMTTIPKSRILLSLGNPLLGLTAFSVAFCTYQSLLETQVLPTGLPSLLLSSPEPQILTSFALSLLLVFRTNSSYGRYDEARKMWAGTLNRCRNIVQQAVTCFPPEDDFGKAAIGRWAVAYSRALAAHVQEDIDLPADLEDVMLPQELELLMAAPNRPLKCLSVMCAVLQQSELTPWQRQQFQLDVTFFHDVLGGCERILKTPIPVSYTRHTCRFLIVWLTALPLGLWEECGWALVPITMIIALLLLGIEEIGVQIEEPFGILPLDVICERIESDVRGLLRDSASVREFVSDLRSNCWLEQDGHSQLHANINVTAAASCSPLLTAIGGPVTLDAAESSTDTGEVCLGEPIQLLSRDESSTSTASAGKLPGGGTDPSKGHPSMP